MKYALTFCALIYSSARVSALDTNNLRASLDESTNNLRASLDESIKNLMDNKSGDDKPRGLAIWPFTSETGTECPSCNCNPAACNCPEVNVPACPACPTAEAVAPLIDYCALVGDTVCNGGDASNDRYSKCENGNSGVICTCKNGWTGKHCEFKKTCEADSPCERGTCKNLIQYDGVGDSESSQTNADTSDDFQCKCPSGYHGKKCNLYNGFLDAGDGTPYTCDITSGGSGNNLMIKDGKCLDRNRCDKDDPYKTSDINADGICVDGAGNPDGKVCVNVIHTMDDTSDEYVASGSAVLDRCITKPQCAATTCPGSKVCFDNDDTSGSNTLKCVDNCDNLSGCPAGKTSQKSSDGDFCICA